MLYLVLEGVFRKWIFPSLSTPLFLLKDVFILLAGMAWFMRQSFKSRADKPRFALPFERLIWRAWVFMCVLYAGAGGFSQMNIIGLRYYLIMLPLIVLFPSLYNISEMDGAAKKYFYLLIPVCLLGIAQYYSPPGAFINRYAWLHTGKNIALSGMDRPRISGTFSYISPFTAYLQAMVFIGWSLYLLARGFREKAVIGVGLVLAFVNLAMTGSRGPFIVVILLSLPFLLALLRNIATGKGKLATLIVTIGVVFLGVYLIADPYAAIKERNGKTAPGELRGRTLGALLTPVYTFADIDIAGIGLGETFLGGQELTGEIAETKFAEVYEDRVGIETGIAGYAFVMFVKVYFLIQTWLLYRRALDERIRRWALASLAYQVSLVWAIPVYNSVAAAFYFLSIGLFCLLRMEQKKLSTARSSVPALETRWAYALWQKTG